MAIKEGSPAPDFNLSGSDGKEHHLNDYRGKMLIVYFYPKDNTSGCTKESCAFAEMFSELQAMEINLLGISKDSLTSHDKFISKFNLPFTLISDPDKVMMQEYEAWGEKKTYGKVSVGCIRSTVLISANGTVLKHWPHVRKAADHPQQVLDFIKGL
ncbi:peroxiredoxin Q/BCP [Desulfuromusa kysingii]|uniref:thioredoxin-dependent peroxiredoxin n=1 Tax=Desulfuromusa kysingii TaxID=37625 RepID=A0A1H3XKU3_9BACT|nr:peroxiredoxin [Desulfuromusa kysingii]SEA00047.1 peroxiredoxin Q/BCP [Desulfuromusa kysingii]